MESDGILIDQPDSEVQETFHIPKQSLGSSAFASDLW